MTMRKSAITKILILCYFLRKCPLTCYNAFVFLAPTQVPVSLVAPTVPPSHGRKFANIVVLAFICICLDLHLVLLIFSDVSELKV